VVPLSDQAPVAAVVDLGTFDGIRVGRAAAADADRFVDADEDAEVFGFVLMFLLVWLACCS
jgi:hypothetical protein